MANLLSIARPYALAAFDYARAQQQLSAWKTFLESGAIIAQDPAVVRILDNPEMQTGKLFELFSEVLSTQLNTERKNFLHLLAQNKRLNAFPDIAEQFNSHVAALEKLSNVKVITAVATEQDFKTKLVAALTKRFQNEVTLECEVDPSLLGGAVIHIGDRVIDGSIRGKLARLLEYSLR